MLLAECLKLSIPVVNVQFSACNSRGIKRRCLSLELQDRSSYAFGAKSAVRTSSRKGVWQQRTRAMYVDDDDEVSSSFSLSLAAHNCDIQSLKVTFDLSCYRLGRGDIVYVEREKAREDEVELRM